MNGGIPAILLTAALGASSEEFCPTLAGLPHPAAALEFPAFVLDEDDFALLEWRHAGSVWWWGAGCEEGGRASSAPYDRTPPIIHGLPARMALVTVDGHPLVTDYMRGGTNLDVVPLALLSSMEVAKLPYGGYWVPGAASGAVALNTLRPGTKERRLSTYGGMLGSFASNALFSGEKYLLAGTLYSIDAAGVAGGLVRRSVLGKYVIVPGLTAQVFHTAADHEDSSDNLTLGALRWEGTVWGDTTLIAGASSSRFERTSSLFPGRVRDDLTRATVALAPAPRGAHGLFFGADLTVEALDHFAVDDASDTSFGCFVRDEYSQTANFSLVAGARYDHSREEGDFFSPMLGCLWRRADTSLRASASLAYRPPSLQELYEDMLDMGEYYFDGNEGLSPEGVLGTQMEYRFPLGKWGGGKAGARGLVFYNWIDNIIEPRYGGTYGGKPIARPSNYDSAHTWGFEFEAGLNWGAWRGSASYTWTEAENDETGARLQYYPGSSVKAGLGYSRGGLRVELRAQFLSDRMAALPTGDAERLDDVNLIDVYVGYRKDAVEYFLGVENLADEEYERAEDDITEAARGAVLVGGLRVKF